MISPIERGQHYIAGTWLEGQGSTFDSINPATLEIIWTGRAATALETQQAVQAAHRALPAWTELTLEQRIYYLHAFGEKIKQYRQSLAETISIDHGKPLWEALTEVSSVIGKIHISIEAYQERCPHKTLPEKEDAQGQLHFKPHGVSAVLGPFNFPAHLANGHIIPALLAGNTVVYKPSELTPRVAQFILRCWDEAGLPPGVINGIQGGKETAQDLLQQDIQAVYFTGSYPTGKIIHRTFSERPDILLALEMGGNNSLIIEPVSNIQAAVYTTLLSALLTSGQRCTCARRLFIPNTAWGQEFLKQLTAAFQQVVIGAYDSEPEPFMGPVIHPAHARHHLEAQEKLLTLGGKALLPMQSLSPIGSFLSPGLIDMTEAKPAPDSEIFAPLLQVYRYECFEQALLLANKTRYGLAAGLISEQPASFIQFYKTIRAGIINWNRPTTGAVSTLPFGGIGDSGNHRPSGYFAADYCSYPVASQMTQALHMPDILLPGVYKT